MTQPVFIVSSGRSGTYLMHKLLSLYPQVESHHEFCCPHIQKLGVLSYLKLLPGGSITYGELRDYYKAAMRYTKAEIWANSSNKDSWLIPSLYQLFPEARFIWLVRDGRRVCESYLHKLPDEVYRDRDVEIMYRWLDTKRGQDNEAIYDEWLGQAPPPEKPYWWPVPYSSSILYQDFRYQWNRWQRLCWFWREINTTIKESLALVPSDRWAMVQLEDLVADRDVLSGLLYFIGLEDTEAAHDLIRKPVNVNKPVNYPVTDEQEDFYWQLCGEMHRQLGYGKGKVYDVRY